MNQKQLQVIIDFNHIEIKSQGDNIQVPIKHTYSKKKGTLLVPTITVPPLEFKETYAEKVIELARPDDEPSYGLSRYTMDIDLSSDLARNIMHISKNMEMLCPANLPHNQQVAVAKQQNPGKFNPAVVSIFHPDFLNIYLKQPNDSEDLNPLVNIMVEQYNLLDDYQSLEDAYKENWHSAYRDWCPTIKDDNSEVILMVPAGRSEFYSSFAKIVVRKRLYEVSFGVTYGNEYMDKTINFESKKQAEDFINTSRDLLTDYHMHHEQIRVQI